MVQLYENDNPTNKSTLTLNSSSDIYPKTLTISVGSEERVRLNARDNFGNQRSLLYVTNQLNWTSASTLLTQESNIAAAERTGYQAVGAHGVQLNNGCFVHEESLMRIRGRMLELDFDCTYRSRLTYDYTLGEGWDSLVHSRISVDGSNNVTWYPGNGRTEFFQYATDTYPYWISPIGLFVKLSGISGVFTLSFPSGIRYKYQNNALVSIEDLHANKIQFIRDSQGRAFRIIDDLGRIYSIDYFDHGRIAEIIDFTGDTVALEYDSVGHLLKIVDQQGLERRFEYESTGAQRMKKLIDRSNRAYCENGYDAAGRVVSQKLPASATSSYSISYSSLDSPPPDGAHVTVTDPLQTVRKYFLDTSAGRYFLTKIRTEANSTLRGIVPGYDWTFASVPSWKEQKRVFNLQNYLPSKVWVEWCAGDIQGGCTGVGEVERTPYLWSDYNAGVQNASNIDPRTFGTLRLRRQDKDINETRTGPSIRESWTYESTTDYTRASSYFEARSWSSLQNDYEVVFSPDSWSVPAAFKTSYSYDALGKGDLVTITSPDVHYPADQIGIAQANTYTSFGQILTSTDPNGVVTKYEYYTSGTQNGRLKKRYIDIPGSGSDPAETFEYDALGRVVTRIDGTGYRWTRTYDAIDRLLTDSMPSTSPFGVLTTTYVYNADDLSEIRYPNKNNSGVTPSGEPATLTTSFQYYPATDARAGALWKVTRYVKSSGNPSLPETATKEYTYDGLFNLARVRNQYAKDGTGAPLYQVTDHFVDESGQEVRFVIYQSDPNAAPADISDDIVGDSYYDVRGNIAAHTDPAGLDTFYEYDAVGRLIATNNPDGSSLRTVYHDPSSASSPVETNYVVNQSQPAVLLSKAQNFEDELGRNYARRVFHDVTLPEAATKYYDVLTWFNKGGQTIRSYDYYTQGLYSSVSYDGAGRVATRTTVGIVGQEPMRETYTYDLNNNITQIDVQEWNEAANPPGYATSWYIINYYDALSRLYKVRQGGLASQDQQEVRYYFDSHGRDRRRTFSTLGLETLTTYDLAGNVTQVKDKIDASTWRQTDITTDYLGRPLTVTKENATGPVTYTYKYDLWGNGRLEEFELPAVGGVADKSKRQFYSNGRLWKEIDPNGTVREHIYDSSSGLLTSVNITPGAGVVLGGPMGQQAISYEYIPAGGCSCSGGVVPKKITTKRNGSLESVVEREYTPLGDLKKEILTAYDNIESPPQLHTNTVSYTYDYNMLDGTPDYNETMYFGDVVANPNAKFIKRSFTENKSIREIMTSLFDNTAGAIIADYKYRGGMRIVEKNYYNTSVGSVSQIRNISDVDAFGWGNRTTNKWSKFVGGTEEQVVDWSATYDAANRIANKKIGRIVAGGGKEGDFQLSHDLLGRLTHTYYSLGAGTPGDWSDTDYQWDKAGKPSKQQQLFSVGMASNQETGACQGGAQCDPVQPGQPVPPAQGYCFTVNQRSTITGVSGCRALAFYDPGLVNMSRRMGPHTLTIDKNGNTLSRTLTWERLDNPDTDPNCTPSYCPDALEIETRNYEWYFEYDAWNRVTFAEKNVSGNWPNWPGGSCPHPYSYSHRYYFTYDGLGRRVFTRFENTNWNNNQCIQDSASLPSDFETLPEQFKLLNVYDKEGRIVQRGSEITYIHGADRTPICGFRGVPGGGQGGGGSVLPAYFYLTDTQENTGCIIDGDGVLSGEGHKTDCNTERVKVTILVSALGPADVYGFDYGDTEPGFRIVDDRNCSPMLVKADGGMYCTTLKCTMGGGDASANEVPKGRCLIYAFCEKGKERKKRSGEKKPDCEVMGQVMAFLKAYCLSQGRESDAPDKATEYDRAESGVYNPKGQANTRGAAFNTFVAWMRTTVKNYKPDSKAKHLQGMWDWFFFIAEMPDAAALNFGAELNVGQMKTLLSEPLLNPNMALDDDRLWKPNIEIYLPGCFSNNIRPTAKKLGLKRTYKNKSSEANIYINSSANIATYNGSWDLSGDPKSLLSASPAAPFFEFLELVTRIKFWRIARRETGVGQGA